MTITREYDEHGRQVAASSHFEQDREDWLWHWVYTGRWDEATAPEEQPPLGILGVGTPTIEPAGPLTIDDIKALLARFQMSPSVYTGPTEPDGSYDTYDPRTGQRNHIRPAVAAPDATEPGREGPSPSTPETQPLRANDDDPWKECMTTALLLLLWSVAMIAVGAVIW